MELIKLDKGDDLKYEFFKQLYVQSFPVEERRELDSIRKLLEADNGIYYIYIIKEEENLGFIVYWNLPQFTYIEYFAIDSTKRSGGIGTVVMKEFINKINKPIVLEVEPPCDEITKRRVSFYERLGFILSNYRYTQPPYNKDLPSLELNLMEWGSDMTQTHPEEIEKILHQKVYGIK